MTEPAGVPLEMNLLLTEIMDGGAARYDEREFSSNIARRLEEATGLAILVPGYPPELTDCGPQEPGYEVVAQVKEIPV